MLKDARERFNTRVKELVDEYENKLGDARKENEFLKERLQEKEDYITTLKSMLAFLQKEKQE